MAMTRTASRLGIVLMSTAVGVVPDAPRFLARAGWLSGAASNAAATLEYGDRSRFIQRPQPPRFTRHEMSDLQAVHDDVLEATKSPLALAPRNHRHFAGRFT